MNQHAIAIALIIAILGILAYLFRIKLKHTWLNIKTRYRLNRLGLKQITNFQCPDGLGYYFNIDRLLMRHDGITVLAFKQYDGNIFCADHIEDWTQMLGGKSFHFKNPLFDLDNQIKAVSACIPNVPINGYLFFGHQSAFPKGHPDRVIHLKRIPEALKRGKKPKAEAFIISAWEKLHKLNVAK